ncbi:permease [Pseudonocardia sp. RS010]|uniref:permease n=1 Tax=Pseudonocardia sp. RS010 TaxID=3385979 RepID=UPI0039A3E6C9
MAGSDDLEERVSALEAEVRRLAERVQHSEQDAAAARVLAGGADRDVAEVRGEIREFREQNNRVLNAMRDDLADMRGDFAGLRGVVSELRSEMQDGFTQIRGALDATAAGQQQITALLTRLIDPDQSSDQ